MQEIIESLRTSLPPLFSVTELHTLTGGSWHGRTIQNLKSQKKIPKDVFLRNGTRKLLVHRDNFLRWAASQLSEV